MMRERIKSWNDLGLSVHASQPDVYGMLAVMATVVCDTGVQHSTVLLAHCITLL